MVYTFLHTTENHIKRSHVGVLDNTLQFVTGSLEESLLQ